MVDIQPSTVFEGSLATIVEQPNHNNVSIHLSTTSGNDSKINLTMSYLVVIIVGDWAIRDTIVTNMNHRVLMLRRPIFLIHLTHPMLLQVLLLSQINSILSHGSSAKW